MESGDDGECGEQNCRVCFRVNMKGYSGSLKPTLIIIYKLIHVRNFVLFRPNYGGCSAMIIAQSRDIVWEGASAIARSHI